MLWDAWEPRATTHAPRTAHHAAAAAAGIWMPLAPGSTPSASSPQPPPPPPTQPGYALLPTTYGHLLATKVALVLLVIGLALYHDFVVGPAAARALEADPRGSAAMALRKRASWIGRINTLLSLVIMTLALLLVRGVPA